MLAKTMKVLSNILQDRNKIVVIGIALIVIMSMFPPWIETFEDQSVIVKRDLGYVFIATPPSYETLGRIDFERLLLQWVIVAMATGGHVSILRNAEANTEATMPPPVGGET